MSEPTTEIIEPELDTVEPEWLTFSYGMTPDETVKLRVNEQCPKGYPMTIKSPVEWRTIVWAIDQGIDSHLEAITTRSKFDHTTGQCTVHPDELHVLLRRLYAFGDSAAQIARNPRQADEAWDLRTAILSTLNIEEL